MMLELVHDRHKFIYDYWLSKKGSKRAPARSDIDPLDFPKILPNLIFYDVLENPLDYRVRIMGTRLVDIFGADLTGLMFSEIFHGEQAKTVLQQFNEVANEFKPSLNVLDAKWLSKDHISYSRLLMPLSSDNNRVDMLFGVAIFKKNN